LLAVGSLAFRERLPEPGSRRVRMLVVVPAHNEELVLARTLRAIVADLRDGDRLMVVDDRSTDRTGAIARAHGALVLARHPDERPGRAAARQAAIDRARSLEWDAMVMIDADSVIEPGFFDAAERMLLTGAAAIQARSEAMRGHGLVDQAALLSFAVQGVLMPRGREALGLAVRLRGTGMVLRRDIVETSEFRAPASEDLVLSLDLVRRGVRIRHLDGARLRSQNAGSWRTATQQKLRYEVGRIAAARRFCGPLLRTRTPASIEAAWFLLTPPIATAVTLLLAGLGIAALSGVTWTMWLLAGAIGTLGCVLALAFVQARLSWRTAVAAGLAPGYLAWKVVVQLRAALLARRGAGEFGATPRH
jgi:cellulose synthase/poly-beta-1,6-N-acetylglucosamine synthase-like glycosyltransferase